MIQGIILSLCALNFALLLALLGVLRRVNLVPGLNLPAAITKPKPLDPRQAQRADLPAEGPPKAEDDSVILMTQDRDSRILDSDEDG